MRYYASSQIFSLNERFFLKKTLAKLREIVYYNQVTSLRPISSVGRAPDS